MTEAERRRLERRASLLKSLAHPSRLLIIELLETAPRCVGELAEAIGCDITTVSKHLAVMKRTGLVRDTKRGTFSEYSLVCDCVTHFVDCIEDGTGQRRVAPRPAASPVAASSAAPRPAAPLAREIGSRYSGRRRKSKTT